MGKAFRELNNVPSNRSESFLKNELRFNFDSEKYENRKGSVNVSNGIKLNGNVTKRWSFTNDKSPLSFLPPVRLKRATSYSNELNVVKRISFGSQPSIHDSYRYNNFGIKDRNPRMTQAYFVSRGPADPADPEGSVGAPIKNFENTEAIHTSRSSKARQKKFHRHFKEVDIEEQVLNYYSCALVGDILLQGHLYITENFFAFYSNVFGYVTKLLIPTVDVLKISKEKTAKIIPNAVGISTEDEKHVFGSLLSRDSTYKFMLQVWKAATSSTPVVTITPPPAAKSELPSDEDSSVTSGNEDTSSYISKVATPASSENLKKLIPEMKKSIIMKSVEIRDQNKQWSSFKITAMLGVSVALFAFLFASAGYLLYRIALIQNHFEEVSFPTKGDVYEDILKWQSTLHSLSASKIQEFLNMNLNQIVKVRLSLEALSTLILPKSNKSPLEKSTRFKWASQNIKESNENTGKDESLKSFWEI